MAAPLPQSEQLKAEGNALFLNNDFVGAYQKYTEAIKHDGKNAVLYCNRAACAFGLGRYMDSCTDATKATELDPLYAKAWGRLAQARTSLNSLNRAVDAWKRAIDALPTENLTPAQTKQRDHYTAELAAIQAKLADIEANPRQPKDTMMISSPDDIPWIRAKALLPGLQAAGQWNSSAWAISRAYQEWQDAMEKMKMGRRISPNAAGMQGYFGHQGVLAGLTNALIADDRVFHTPDGFLELYNKQVAFEIATAGGWSDSGARTIMEQIPAKLRSGGWGVLRPAISITVRGWIMRGFIEYRLNENFESALEFYTSALDLLQWGRELWKDVSFEDKGAVFQTTFIRGVKGLRLDMLLAAYSTVPAERLKFPLTEILAGADDLLAELEGVPEEPENTDDFGFYLSFSRYPRGQAHAVRGFYFQHDAKEKWEKEESSPSDRAEADSELVQSSAEYFKAASYYPVDDEKHAWYLHVAFSTLFDVGGSVDTLLDILNRLHDALPHTKTIWEFGAISKSNVQAAFEQDMHHREELLCTVEGKSEDELRGLTVRCEAVVDEATAADTAA